MVPTRLIPAELARAALLSLLAVPGARAGEPNHTLGLWDQIASDAGRCAACAIEIRGADDAVTIVANNGWSARLHETDSDRVAGDGRWSAAIHGPYAGRGFKVDVRLIGDRLHLTMTLESGAPRRVVRGVYRKRGWVGM